MSKLKVMTIVGTRPEIIKLSEVIKQCDKYFNHILVHTGQNYDYTLNDIFFKELGFSLKEIKDILDNPNYDRELALHTHKNLLIEKKSRIEKLILSVENTIKTIKGERTMSKKEMFEAFDDTKLDEYKKEAKTRWLNILKLIMSKLKKNR